MYSFFFFENATQCSVRTIHRVVSAFKGDKRAEEQKNLLVLRIDTLEHNDWQRFALDVDDNRSSGCRRVLIRAFAREFFTPHS